MASTMATVATAEATMQPVGGLKPGKSTREQVFGTLDENTFCLYGPDKIGGGFNVIETLHREGGSMLGFCVKVVDCLARWGLSSGGLPVVTAPGMFLLDSGPGREAPVEVFWRAGFDCFEAIPRRETDGSLTMSQSFRRIVFNPRRAFEE